MTFLRHLNRQRMQFRLMWIGKRHIGRSIELYDNHGQEAFDTRINKLLRAQHTEQMILLLAGSLDNQTRPLIWPPLP